MIVRRYQGLAGDDGTVISAKQERVHKATELLSLLSVPVFAYLALAKSHRLPTWARLLMGAYGAGIIAVDGGLLLTWAAKSRGEPGPYGALQ